MKKVFSFDAETNGLWGQAFAIGALVYDEQGTEIARFVGRCPIEGETDKWVAENVLPKMADIPETQSTYVGLLANFAEFYKANKQDADIVVHMGVPVESKVLIDMHTKGFIGDWDGPSPLHDVSGNLQAAGADPTSVDKFASEHNLSVSEFTGGTHNPLYDSAVAAVVYRHLLKDEWRTARLSVETSKKEASNKKRAAHDKITRLTAEAGTRLQKAMAGSRGRVRVQIDDLGDAAEFYKLASSLIRSPEVRISGGEIIKALQKYVPGANIEVFWEYAQHYGSMGPGKSSGCYLEVTF